MKDRTFVVASFLVNMKVFNQRFEITSGLCYGQVKNRPLKTKELHIANFFLR